MTGDTPFALAAGDHVLTLCIDAGDANIDKLDISGSVYNDAVASPGPATSSSLRGTAAPTGACSNEYLMVLMKMYISTKCVHVCKYTHTFIYTDRYMTML